MHRCGFTYGQIHQVKSTCRLWNSPGKNTGVGGHSLPDPGLEARSPALQAGLLPFEPPEKPPVFRGMTLNTIECPLSSAICQGVEFRVRVKYSVLSIN